MIILFNYDSLRAFPPSRYFDHILQDINYRHLHKLNNNDLDPKLIDILRPHFIGKSWRLIENTFKAEFITLKSFYLLTEKHFEAVNLDLGNTAILLSLQ